MKPRILVAKSAGFCFGVGRAVQLTEDLAKQGKQVCTLGPIIHNEQETQRLAKQGIRIVDSPKQVRLGETLVIRSHGVPADVIRTLEDLGIPYVDATCPFVKKIHRIVGSRDPQTDCVLIAGDVEHPEVQGILGNCSCPS